MRDTPPTPVFYGQIHFGTFRDPFEAVNLVEADIYGHKWAPRWWRNFRLKEWYRLTILTDDLCCEIELFDTKVMALSSVFIYDRTSTHPIEHQRAALQRGAIQMPEQPLRGNGFFRQPGYHIQIENRQTEHYLTTAIQNRRSPIQANLAIQASAIQPLIVVLPVNNYRRPLYTHKTICTVDGFLRAGDREWTLRHQQACIEIHKAFYPHETLWTEATLTGQDRQGLSLVVNLKRNIIHDDDRWNECCVWIDGTLHQLGAARFDQERLWTTDGRVEFTFTPQHTRTNDKRLGQFFQSQMHQSFGLAHGYIINDSGQRHEIDTAVGLVTHHQLKA
jgi:hypothetical protein